MRHEIARVLPIGVQALVYEREPPQHEAPPNDIYFVDKSFAVFIIFSRMSYRNGPPSAS
jgi:hypothetical protein